MWICNWDWFFPFPLGSKTELWILVLNRLNLCCVEKSTAKSIVIFSHAKEQKRLPICVKIEKERKCLFSRRFWCCRLFLRRKNTFATSVWTEFRILCFLPQKRILSLSQCRFDPDTHFPGVTLESLFVQKQANTAFSSSQRYGGRNKIRLRVFFFQIALWNPFRSFSWSCGSYWSFSCDCGRQGVAPATSRCQVECSS